MSRLLLHACCAPCATSVIERLRSDHELTLIFVNPNIQPAAEHRRRRIELEGYAVDQGLPLLEHADDLPAWSRDVVGLEDEPEGGARCTICFRHRLAIVARAAQEGGFDAIATTLTVSPHKDAPRINRILTEEASRRGLTAVAGDWKKQDGFKLSCRLSRQAGLYRQDYCGCIFSRRERDARRKAPRPPRSA